MAWYLVKYREQRVALLSEEYLHVSRDSSVGTATRLRAGRLGRLGFDSRRGLGIFLFPTVARPALGPTHSPIQWIPGGKAARA
jgi:hypothetical protein